MIARVRLFCVRHPTYIIVVLGILENSSLMHAVLLSHTSCVRLYLGAVLEDSLLRHAISLPHTPLLRLYFESSLMIVRLSIPLRSLAFPACAYILGAA